MIGYRDWQDQAYNIEMARDIKKKNRRKGFIFLALLPLALLSLYAIVGIFFLPFVLYKIYTYLIRKPDFTHDDLEVMLKETGIKIETAA